MDLEELEYRAVKLNNFCFNSCSKIMKSSQVTFINIALFTIQIVSKQLHSDSDNMNIIQKSCFSSKLVTHL